MSKILIISNKYQFFGGTEQVVLNEINLLKNKGHNVRLLEFDNNSIKKYNFFQKIKFILNSFYSFDSRKKLKQVLVDFRPDYIHIHNIYPLISLSIYGILNSLETPVFQSFHDHRLAGLCPQGNAFRNNKFCDKCFNGNFLYAVYYRCIKNNSILSIVYAFNLFINKKFRIIENGIDFAIVFNDYMKNRLLKVGFNEEKIFVKPHFTEIINGIKKNKKEYIIFIGAIDNHKGIFTLIYAYELLKNKIPLIIVGNGEKINELKKYVIDHNLSNISFVGEIRNDYEKYKLIADSLVSIIPSESPETFCLTAIESMSVGAPIISSDIGSLRYLINNKKNGFKFKCGDHNDLSNKIDYIIENKSDRIKLGINAKKTFLNNYTPNQNYNYFERLFHKANNKKE
tara:strand:- start:7847 stop:9040 length:1194 start_codon:yes stop_codon:yes gene_type:complete